MNHIIEEVLENPEGIEYSFTTEKDLNNIESMGYWIEENDLEELVTEDDGTLVFLLDPETKTKFSVESYGQGDFFSHGIFVKVHTEDS